MWQIQQIQLTDSVFNETMLNTDDLMSLGLPTDVNVASTPSDISPTGLINLDFNDKVIDTKTGPQIVKVTLDLTDNLSGVEFSLWGGASYIGGFTFFSPGFLQVRQAGWQDFNLTEGSVIDGQWEANIFFPQYSDAGVWHVYQVNFGDAVHNGKYLRTADLQAMGFPTELSVIGVIPAANVMLDVDPDTLNLKSKGKPVPCYIQFTGEYDIRNVDPYTLAVTGINGNNLSVKLYPIGPSNIGDHNDDGVQDLMVQFDRQDLISLLNVGDTLITVSGEMLDGSVFSGSDVIRVIE